MNPDAGGWESAKPAPAILRAGKVLHALAEHRGALSAANLAHRLDIPRSSAMNVCLALTQVGLLRTDNAGFQLGPGLVELAQDYLDTLDPVREFTTLARRMPPIDETLQLGTLDMSDVVYLAVHGGKTPLRIVSQVGSRISATCTALGKAMLATIDDDTVHQLLEDQQPFIKNTASSITELPALLDELHATRQRGYAIDNEETIEGITCLALAIPQSSTPPFAVSTSLLTSQVNHRRQKQLVSLISDIVAQLASPNHLGSRPSPTVE